MRGESCPPEGYAAEAGWTSESLTRERREYFLALTAASLIFSAYFLADLWLEPGLVDGFAALRLVGAIVLATSAIAVRRAQNLASARAWFAVPISLSGAMVAVMLPLVEHFAVYLVGYSAFFWGTFLLSWPVALALATFTWHLASVLAAFVLIPGHRTHADYLSAALFLAAAAALTSLSSYARRAAHRREFEVSRELAERNTDLAQTLASLRETQARLVAQEKLSALGRMLAGLSHEMNNPLNVLKNNLDPIREHFTVLLELVNRARASTNGDSRAVDAAWKEFEMDWRKADLADALDGMREATERVQQVNVDLRAFIRGDTPGIVRAKVSDGLRATAALLLRRVPERVNLCLELADVPDVCCYPGQLNQVWLNLIQNALEAVGPTGNVMVRSAYSNDRIEVSVTDDGAGVRSSFRPRLFEPFATTKGVGAGTGLGLATSYQIIERHGGRLYYDESHTRGARFVVELPCSD